MSTSLLVKLFMTAATVLMVANWVIYRHVARQSSDLHVSERDTGSASAYTGIEDLEDLVKDIELQLERKEAIIRQLERHLDGQRAEELPSNKLPPRELASGRRRQTLTVGWEWTNRKSRTVTFFDGNKARTYATTYKGSMASPDKPGLDWWDNIDNRWWEMDTYFVYKTFLKPTSTLIDFGAWIGPTLLYGGHQHNLDVKASFPQAKEAYGLEPDPFAFDELRANVALNPVLQDHTWIYWKCIMDKPGIYRMGGGGGDSMASVGDGYRPKTWMVDCTTLPQFIQEHQIKNLDLIKIDTEGAEHVIIPSLAGWLRKQTSKPTLWLSIHKWNFAPGGDIAIIEVLRLYKHVFEGDSMRVDLTSYELCNFCTILATDLDVPIHRE